jgi:hypothetical protein
LNELDLKLKNAIEKAKEWMIKVTFEGFLKQMLYDKMLSLKDVARDST